MNKRIKIIIADDNKYFCDLLNNYLSQYEMIEVMGIAYTDADEIALIEKLNPEIVLTDLIRENYQYTGLEIIKQYNRKKNSPMFLVVSAVPPNYIGNFEEYSVIGRIY